MAINIPTSALLMVFELTSLLALVVSITFGKWIFAGIIVLLATLAFTGSFLLDADGDAPPPPPAQAPTRTDGADAVDPYYHMQEGDLEAGRLAAASSLSSDDDNHDDGVIRGVAERDAPAAGGMKRDPVSQFTSYEDALRAYTDDRHGDYNVLTAKQENEFLMRKVMRFRTQDQPYLADV